MKATVDRGYSQFYAEQTNELLHDYSILDKPFEVLAKVDNVDNRESGYRLRDMDGYIHPFVPAEFVTIIEE